VRSQHRSEGLLGASPCRRAERSAERERKVFANWTLAHRRKTIRAAVGKNFQTGDSTPQIRTKDEKSNPLAGASGSEDLANRD
jgi:hypothetical protein